MDFPSFGDADVFFQVGQSCASAIEGTDGIFFSECYHPLRPIGAIFFYSLPYILSNDPIDVNYIILMVNVLLFLSIFLSLKYFTISDPSIQPKRTKISPSSVSAITFFPLILNLIAHIPIALSELPSLAFFMFALYIAARIIFQVNSTAELTGRYLAIGLFLSISVLMKQSYFIFSFYLIFSILFFDKNISKNYKKKCIYFFLFLLGFTPICLQFFNVYLHSGDFWLYESVHLQVFDEANTKPSVELIAYNIPIQSAFLVKVTNEINELSYVVLKLYRGLFSFEWAVYIGNVSNQEQFWTLSKLDFVRIYFLVALYVIFSLVNIFVGPISLKLLNFNSFLIAITTAFIMHTEIRYYIFPRLIFSITILYWLLYLVKNVSKKSRRFEALF